MSSPELEPLDRLVVDAAETTTAAILMVDPTNVIVWHNQQLALLLGYRQRELFGKPVTTILPDLGKSQLCLPHAPQPNFTSSDLRPSSPATQLRRRDGSLITTEVNLGVSGTAVKPYAIITIRDRSAERRLERKMDELTSQVTTLNRLETTQFLATSVLHDFNNILTAIAGHAHLALNADSRDSARIAMETVLDATTRGTRLIRRLRGVDPAERPCERGVSWQPIAQEALALLRGALPKQVRLEWSLSDATPFVGCTDSEAHQLVMNLGMNGATAMADRGGTLMVTLRSIVVGNREL